MDGRLDAVRDSVTMVVGVAVFGVLMTAAFGVSGLRWLVVLSVFAGCIFAWQHMWKALLELSRDMDGISSQSAEVVETANRERSARDDTIQAAAPALFYALNSDDDHAAESAFQALSRTPAFTTPVLLERLQRHPGEASERALALLGSIGTAASLDRLAELFTEAEEPTNVRAGRALVSSPSGLKRLTGLISSADSRIAMDAVMALREGGRDACAELLTLKTSRDARVRWLAIWGLGGFYYPEAVDTLQHAQGDEDESVRELARRCLQELGHESLQQPGNADLFG